MNIGLWIIVIVGGAVGILSTLYCVVSLIVYIFAEIAVFCVALELLIDRFCNRPLALGWSAIVLTVCSVIVIALITMLSMQRLRDAVRRRLHF